MYFLRHWRLQSSVGKLLKCTIAWAQLGTGMSYSILAQVTISLPHLEAKWIASLREFLATISASILLDDPCIPPPQRENDKYLMDLIIQSGRYSTAQVQKLNYCRLYLQAVTLSDITKPNGHELDPCLLAGRPSLFSSRTRWHTVQQDRPSESEWKLWKTANSLWSDQYGHLFQPLGAWLQSLPNHRFQLFAYKYRKSLFILTEDGEYAVFRQSKANRYRPSTSSPTRAYIHLPERACPAEVSPSLNNGWQLNGNPAPMLRIRALSSSSTATFDLLVSSLDPWETELLNLVTFNVDPFSLCLELTPGFRAVSDGSVKLQQHASFGWVLSTLDGVRLATGMGPARGRLPKSYRAEAYGLLSFLRFLIRVKELTSMQAPWSGILATDNQGVLDTLKVGDLDPQEQETPVDLNNGEIV